MGIYRWRDAIRVPGLLSVARLPLAAAFPFVVSRPPLALGVIAIAGLSDVLDGWYARKFGQVTATGAALDPLTDKAFVVTVATTLVVLRLLSPLDLALLATRELIELPLVLWIAVSRRARKSRAARASANVPGKLATALQFVAVALCLLRATETRVAVVAAAVAGAIAAIAYWARALREVREVDSAAA